MAYDEDVMQEEVLGIAGDDVFATDEPEVPAVKPDAHKGVITGVTKETFDSGATAMKVSLTSTDVPTVTADWLIFLPRGFAENINVKVDSLPETEGNKQQTSFRIGVANSDKSATLQELRKIAAEEGRTGKSLGLNPPSNIDDFIANHGALLTGLPVIFTRRPDTGDNVDPRFKNQLRVKGVYAIANADNPKFLKKGGYVKNWE